MFSKFKGGFTASFIPAGNRGFTLIELLIVVSIVGIIASLALPAYQTYFKRSKFSEIILIGGSVKEVVDACYQTRGNGSLSSCDQEVELGLSFPDITARNNVTSINIIENTATIVLTASPDLESATFILTPTSSQGTLIWSQSGTCIEIGLC